MADRERNRGPAGVEQKLIAGKQRTISWGGSVDGGGRLDLNQEVGQRKGLNTDQGIGGREDLSVER